MSAIPLVLLNGSLGSGKTTLVRRLLNSPEFEGSFVIENEFANVNIDSESLADEHDDEIYEISGSCICCSTGEELEEALADVAGRRWSKPVILEATGMANSAILLRRLYLNPRFTELFHILCTVLLIDASETESDHISKELVLEVKLADIVIVNKSDLAKANAQKLAAKVRDLNVGAKVVLATDANVDIELFSAAKSSAEMAFAQVFPELDQIELDTSTYAVVYPDHPLDPEKVRAALRPSSFPDGVRLRRAKGFFVDHSGDHWQVEATAKQVRLHKLRKPNQSVLVAIGEGITKDALKEALI